jgi:DNA-binding transcriptional LysR family regulator
LAYLDDACAKARAVEQGYLGQLRIGLADPLAQPQLTRLLALCREEEPLTKIKIQEIADDRMAEALHYEQIDACFTVNPESARELRKEIVWWDRFAVAIPRNHPLVALSPIPLREIAKFPLLVFHPQSCHGGYELIRRGFLDAMASSPRVAEYVSGHEPMMMLAAAGYGIGIGLESQIALYRHPEVIVRPVADDVPRLATFLVIPDRPPSHDLGHFIARVQQIGEMATIH